MQTILFPSDVSQANISSIGGKARSLWLLDRQGFPVPAFFVVDARLFREAVWEDAELAALWRKWRSKAATARALVERVRAIPFPAAFGAELEAAMRRLGDGPVSVRSSATAEDRYARSFAGQFQSTLFVKGAEAVARELRGCWASAFSEGVLAYAGAREADPPAMAVVVQRMVAGDVSGVAFSVDPVAEDFGRMVVTAGYGTCDGIVADRVGTDQYSVTRLTRVIERTLGDKSKKLEQAPAGDAGTAEAPVGSADASRPALDDARVLELAGLVEDVERRWGVPVDVEWTLAGGKFHLLQARMITTLTRKDPRAAPRLLWDNSNIVESYSGVTSPLTFTFASSGYAVIYRQFGKLVGDSEAFLKAHERDLQNMLGLHKGRVYYNLLNWYLALYYMPGFRFNKGAMESMMGVKESMDFNVPTGPMTLREKLFEAGATAWAVARILYNSAFVDRRVRAFHENFERVYGDAAARDLSRMPVPEILELATRVRENLMYRWTAPILTDCLAMVFMKLLKTSVAKFVDTDRSGLENDLLAGEGGIDSTRPTKTLLALAARIRDDRAASELFAAGPEPAVRAAVEREQRFAWIRDAIEEFRAEFGFRCIGELKLELDSIKEDPSFVYSMLANYVRQPHLDLSMMEARERQRRSEAEKHVEEHLRSDGWLGRSGRRVLLDWIVEHARKHVKDRENMRFARTRIFGFFREVFNAVGAKFFAAGLLEHPRDIYYLTYDEVFAFNEGRSVTQDIGALARLRYEEYQRFRRESVPDRFSTQGTVYMPGNQRPDPQKTAPVQADAGSNGRTLQGVSCCPGIVQGKVRVIRDATDDLRLSGEILVAARTDPGWVPLFPSASGLLIESGSVLSHSAIVARELGIPAIVGIKGLLDRVEDGQVVRMDAGRGVVELEPEAAQRS